jgi:ribonuclease HI
VPRRRKVHIYTDGSSAIYQPGRPGGWAAMMIDCLSNNKWYRSGGSMNTSPHQMEIQAAIGGLESLTSPCQVTIFTDSAYLIDAALSDFRFGRHKKALLCLDELCRIHDVRWKKVKAHDGVRHNEQMDELAKTARREALAEARKRKR